MKTLKLLRVKCNSNFIDFIELRDQEKPIFGTLETFWNDLAHPNISIDYTTMFTGISYQ
jgi:hypothetical protein